MKRNRRVARGTPARARPAAVRPARARARPSWARPSWARRGLLAATLLAVAFVPVPGTASGQPPPACHGCRPQAAGAERWAARLAGAWAAGAGATGTVPLTGQAYVAVGGGIAAVGHGLTVTGYRLRDGRPLWRVRLDAPAGTAIMSVRAWPGVVTAGLAASGGRARTEAVLDGITGTVLRRYPADVFGGAVAASPAATVIVGPSSVTSYDNDNGRIRWRVPAGQGQPWRAAGRILYVAESPGGYLGSAPVTGLEVINLDSGTERTLHSPPGHAFSGRLSVAADDAVLFTSAAGVTAYSGLTGGALWTMPAVVPEGTDPSTGLVYLTSARGALVGVDPLTGRVRASVSGSTAGGSAGMYVVRGGVALGLDSGQGGEAWGYNMAAGRVTWTAPGLPWPHYFSDLSGLGGSAALSGNLVVVAACPHLGPASPPSGTASPPGSGPSPPVTGSPASAAAGSAVSASSGASAASSSSASPSQSAAPAPVASPAPVHLCADPELVALAL